MTTTEELIDVPHVQFSSFLGFAGHLTRGLHVLPSGRELVYSVGSHVAFLQIQEREDRVAATKVAPLTRKVGGGAAEPRTRAFGGQTIAPSASRVLTSTHGRGPLIKDATVEVPRAEDTSVIVPGSTIRPVLVSGHSGQISAMALSVSGRFLVTGTAAPAQKAAEIIVWDVEQKVPLSVQQAHKGSISDIAIAPDESYFCTLGVDNQLLFFPLTDEYDFPAFQPIAGRKIVNAARTLVTILAVSRSCLMLAGDDYLNFIGVDLASRQLSDSPVRIPLRRKITCMRLVGDYVYAGTEQGDVIKIDPAKQTALQACPSKKPFAGVVTSIAQNDVSNIIVSTTAGRVYLIRTDAMTPVQQNEIQTATGGSQATATTSALQTGSAQLNSPSPLNNCVNCAVSGIAALAAAPGSPFVYAMGPNCLARVNKSSLEARLLQTAPPGIQSPCGISSVATPLDTSRVFVTACGSFIQIWSSQTGAELLRVFVPGLTCHCVRLSPDGTAVVSGWSDGSLRAFAPQSGRAVYCMYNVHAGGLTALALSPDGAFAFTGGADAKVCVVNLCNQTLVQATQGHRKEVTSVSLEQLQVQGGAMELTTVCAGGFVQNFHVVQNGASCEIRAAWNSRAEGSLAGVVELKDGAQVVGVGSGGVTWFNCGKNAGAVIRQVPLYAAASAVALEERGDTARLVVGLVNGHILVIDWDTGRVERQLRVHGAEIRAIAIESGAVLAGGLDGGVVAFDLWD